MDFGRHYYETGVVGIFKVPTMTNVRLHETKYLTVFCASAAYARQKSVRQPVAHRLVVDLDARIGDCYRCYEYYRRDPDMGSERSIGIARRPVHLDVYHRIVGYVERIRYATEELAYRSCLFTRQWASRTGSDDRRKDEEYRDRAI